MSNFYEKIKESAASRRRVQKVLKVLRFDTASGREGFGWRL